MTDKLLDRITDAQDIFGLLRRWSPVFLTGEHKGYKSAIADPDQLAIVSAEGSELVESVALDLTDKYGRVDAAWWILDQKRGRTDSAAGSKTMTLVEFAQRGADMERHEIDELARIVLRLAGREA